jgi:hypothetical protein
MCEDATLHQKSSIVNKQSSIKIVPARTKSRYKNPG